MKDQLIQNLARDAWSEAFALSLRAPAPSRPFLWGLIAYLDALAKIDDMVSDPTLKLIRLRWWRDHVGQDVMGQPILQALALRPDLVGDLDRLAELHETKTIEIDKIFWIIWLKASGTEPSVPDDFIETASKTRLVWTGYGVDTDITTLSFNTIPKTLKPLAKALCRSWNGNPSWRYLRILLNI